MRLLFLAFALLFGTGPAWAGNLEVRVHNVGDAAGTIRAQVCQRTEWLNEDGCTRAANAPATPGVTTLLIPDVPPGDWAVVVFHDRRNTGEVARNLLGIPKEGVGFSRNPSLGLHGPRFADSAVTLGDDGAVIDLRLKFE
jgi:uncharacterized protein (DUF2141 family)